jgi:hypothetical protein
MKIPICGLLIGSATIMLAACSSGDKVAQTPVTTPTASTAMETKMSAKKGGQVVESGKYHLELVPEKSANETHLDLFILSGTDHQAIADAKVSGEVQSPDGKQQTLTFTYDTDGKHYAAVVPGKTAGAYQLKVTAAIGSEKADGRFNFDR